MQDARILSSELVLADQAMCLVDHERANIDTRVPASIQVLDHRQAKRQGTAADIEDTLLRQQPERLKKPHLEIAVTQILAGEAHHSLQPALFLFPGIALREEQPTSEIAERCAHDSPLLALEEHADDSLCGLRGG